MTTELLILIATHFACDDIASERRLTSAEAQHCGAVYESIKLAFVPGVTPDDFRDLTLEERIAISNSGFLAFLDWRAEHPEMVRHLEAVARGEEELSTAG